jgi:ATP-dependent Clp protease ATP-binding subunit ClpA
MKGIFLMFGAIRQRLRDMGTIKTLLLEAEKLANAEGFKEPGAEHLVMSALALSDGTARKAFLRINVDPNDFRAAITRQYQDALKNVGITVPPDTLAASEKAALPTSPIYKAQPSAQALMQTMLHEIKHTEKKENPNTPLLSAHVLLAATTAQYSVAARTFRAMGIDLEKLADAAQAEIGAYRMGRL